jgi:hypothetical protein
MSRPLTRESNREKHPGLVVAASSRRSSSEVAAALKKKTDDQEKKKAAHAEAVNKVSVLEARLVEQDHTYAAAVARPCPKAAGHAEGKSPLFPLSNMGTDDPKTLLDARKYLTQQLFDRRDQKNTPR